MFCALVVPRALNVPCKPPDVPPTSGRVISRLGTLYSTSAQMSRPPGVPCSSCSLEVHAGVRGGRVDDRRGAGDRDRLGDRRDASAACRAARSGRRAPGRSRERRCGSPAVPPSRNRCPAAATGSDSRRRYRSRPPSCPTPAPGSKASPTRPARRRPVHRSRGPGSNPSALARRRATPQRPVRARAASHTRTRFIASLLRESVRALRDFG